ncbi:MAG TPA: hypothetical protein VNE62_07770 [Actinomycetota bacterium]|nr:hypothetical protein [Actinomycetota bacterium]
MIGETSAEALTRSQRAFLEAFVLAAVIVWSPLKLLAYFAPLISLGWYAIRSGDSRPMRSVALWGAGWACVISIHGLANGEMNMPAAFMAPLTYGSFIWLTSVRGVSLRSNVLLRRVFRTVVVVAVVEATVGLVQAAYGFARTRSFDLAAGDHVEGTIDLALEPDRAFSNPIFAAAMASMFIFLIASATLFRKGWGMAALVAVALLLASVVHVLLFAMTAMLAAALLVPRVTTGWFRKSVPALVLLAAIGSVFVVTQPRNAAAIRLLVEEKLAGRDPRSAVTARALAQMPREYPSMIAWGLGPGQFSSRAALIGTGLYFGGPLNPRPLPFIRGDISEPQDRFLMDLWLAAARAGDYGYGSSQQPYYSWLSVYTEFGLLAVALVVLTLVWALLRLAKQARSPGPLAWSVGAGAMVVFIALLGAQENYWEIPQALLLPVLLLKLMWSQAEEPPGSKAQGKAHGGLPADRPRRGPRNQPTPV